MQMGHIVPHCGRPVPCKYLSAILVCQQHTTAYYKYPSMGTGTTPVTGRDCRRLAVFSLVSLRSMNRQET